MALLLQGKLKSYFEKEILELKKTLQRLDNMKIELDENNSVIT